MKTGGIPNSRDFAAALLGPEFPLELSMSVDDLLSNFRLPIQTMHYDKADKGNP